MINIPQSQLKEILLKEGLIDEVGFNQAVAGAERLKQNVAETLVSKNIISAEYLYQALSRYFNIPLAELSHKAINETILQTFPELHARQKNIVLFGEEANGYFSAAMENPTNLEAIEFVEQFVGRKITPYFATEKDLYKGFALYSKKQSTDHRQLIEASVNDALKLGKKGEEAAADAPIIGIVDNIIAYAVNLHSSDIHIEIFEDGILIRYRIDGMLYEITKMPKIIHSAIVARIKLLAELKLDEHYKPQDGRFRYKTNDRSFVDIRVSIIPTFHGEKTEMRLLTAASRPLSFLEIGMFDDTIALINENIRKSYGMILVCGPTGSGKTTTLYTILSALNRPEVNIITIEDPIEYNIKYINQTQVNPAAGVTFANGLRAVLRQDPNVIFVGEIRDDETASIAVQAALTGHIVLSSLHTNDALTTIPRLIDMNVPPFLIASVLNAVIAQRLVRKICLDCIYSIKPSPAIISVLKQQMVEIGIEKDFVPPKFIYKGKGCSSCGGIGYRGRIGLFEILNISEEIRQEIVSPEFSLDRVKKISREQKMISMFEDGLRKVEKGMTTAEELLRVIKA